VEIRLRDFNVVAKHAIVANLQRADSGSPALAIFQPGDDLLARSTDSPKVVDFGVDAVTNQASLTNQCGRFIDDRPLDGVPDICQVIELTDEASHQRRLECVEDQPHTRHGRQRLSETHEIPRPGGSERGPRNQTLEVVDRLQHLAELAAFDRLECQFLDDVEAILDPIE
jgi:hypothetical protein